MAKINIPFYNSNYSIEESALASAKARLQSHFSTVMNGTGATINLDGILYNIDATKLADATNKFVAHLGTVSGNGSKVIVNGITYNIDSTKMSNAITDMHTVLGGLHSDSGDSGDDGGDAFTNPELNPIGTIPEGAYYGNFNTYTFYDTMPDTVSDGDAYLYGDYIYTYQSALDGWDVSLILEESGILNIIPNYPVTDKNQTSYGVILESINGKPIVCLGYTFRGCALLETAPDIPCGVVDIVEAFCDCTSLANVNITPNTITEIDVGMFKGCTSLENIVIPSGINWIFNDAFSSCTSLTSITIPNSVTNIGDSAFYNCTSLTTIEFIGTITQWSHVGKSSSWNLNVPATKVICSDGEVSLV